MTKNSTISVWYNSHWYIIYAMHYITFISQTTWKICFTIIMFKAVRQFCLLYLAINIYSICFSCKWYCMASFYPPSNRNYQCVCVIMNACFFVFLQKKNPISPQSYLPITHFLVSGECPFPTIYIRAIQNAVHFLGKHNALKRAQKRHWSMILFAFVLVAVWNSGYHLNT